MVHDVLFDKNDMITFLIQSNKYTNIIWLLSGNIVGYYRTVITD